MRAVSPPRQRNKPITKPKTCLELRNKWCEILCEFFFFFAQGSLPYFAVIWFCVLQILKCLHGGCGQLNKQQLSPISGGQLLTKKKKDKENRKAAKTSGRKTQQGGGPRVCGIVANLSSRESRKEVSPLLPLSQDVPFVGHAS